MNVSDNFCASNSSVTALTYIDLNFVTELKQTFPQPNTDQSYSEVTLGCSKGPMCPS